MEEELENKIKMGLKSYSNFEKKSQKKSKKSKKPFGDIITGGVTALIGIGLLSETAEAVARV